MIKKLLIASLLVNLLITNQLAAKDFGQQGQVYQIKEEGIIAMIERKLAQVDIEKEQEQLKKLVKERNLEPQRVVGISKATEDRSFYYDPSYQLTKDVVLPDGTIYYRAGTKINPLDHMEFERRLLFIDGLDQEQVSWLKTKLATPHTGSQDLVILIAGRPMELALELKELGFKQVLGKGAKEARAEAEDFAVYFDQAGEITSQMGINAVPAVAYQEGKQIKIEQIKLEEA